LETALTDWTTIALSGGSVCIGAGLTMLGQYFSDRRSYVRDREARREQFRITNYEIQRSALLELQETILNLSNLLSGVPMQSIWQNALNAVFPERAKVLEWHHAHKLLPEWTAKITEGVALAIEARESANLSVERKGKSVCV
jgi:hypothetical protein